MSHIANGSRAFITVRGEYGDKVRPFLGIQNSAVVVSDDGATLGFAGRQAQVDLVDATTKEDGTGTVVTVPTDFRMAGIAVMTALGIPVPQQINMFEHFMALSQEQRKVYVDQYDAVDRNNPAAVQQFVDAMTALFNV